MSELKPLPSMQDDPTYVPPDAFDLTLASKIILSPCPFCGSKGVKPLGSPRLVKGGYQYHIQCGQYHSPWCMGSVFGNGPSRAESRLGAVRAWERRGGELYEDNQAVKFTKLFNQREEFNQILQMEMESEAAELPDEAEGNGLPFCNGCHNSGVNRGGGDCTECP